jgi:hypothetical protein
VKRGRLRSNDPTAASRPADRADCDRDALRCGTWFRRIVIVVQMSRFRRKAGEFHAKSAADGLEHSRVMRPNVEGNRVADETWIEDQGVCRRGRLTGRSGLDPSHFAGQQGREGIQEKRDERS